MELILPLDSKLFPAITREIWDKYKNDKEFQSDEAARCQIEPWYWLVNYVYTIKRDEQEISSVERFPPEEYLQYIFHKCFAEPYLAIDKARQLLLTWIMMAYELWNAMYHKNELIICQTKKKEDVDEELIKRGHFIWKNLPTWLKPKCIPSFCKLKFPSINSQVLGIPSGPDQIRSHNPNRVFLDEGGFFEGNFEDCRTAALACASDIKCVSTANAGQWQEFIEDKLAA